jgi:hypothetical protein
MEIKIINQNRRTAKKIKNAYIQLEYERSGAPKGIRIPVNVLSLLNKLPTNQIAEFSKLTEGYISQVKNGYRPPSQKLMQSLWDYTCKNNQHKHLGDIEKAIDLFLKSRRDGVTCGTLVTFPPETVSF